MDLDLQPAVAEGLQFPEGLIIMADGSVILVEMLKKKTLESRASAGRDDHGRRGTRRRPERSGGRPGWRGLCLQ